MYKYAKIRGVKMTEIEQLKYDLEQSQIREQETYVQMYELQIYADALELENKELKQKLAYQNKTTFQKLSM